MSLDEFILLSKVATFSSFLLFLLFFTRKRLWKTSFRWLGLSAIASVFFDALSHYLIKQDLNPNIAINIWIITEFIVASLLYCSFFKRESIRSILIVMMVLLSLFGLFNFFYLEGPTILNSYTRSAASFILVIYAVYFFFQLLTDLPAERLTRYPMFWVSAGVLLYFSGTFILNVSIRYLVNTLKSDLIFFWAFLLILNIIKNILFGVGCWYRLKSEGGK